MKLTKNVFKFIADIIKNSELGILDKHRIANDFMYALQETNSMFNRQKFLDACLKDEEK